MSATDRKKHQINIALRKDEMRATGRRRRWIGDALGSQQPAPAIVVDVARHLLSDGNIGLEDAFR